MKFPRRERVDANVELTPLIDVVFLLLIFFMVSTTFIRETQLQIKLPEASGDLQEVEPDFLEVTIDRKGDYAVNDRVLVNNELETLVRALVEVAREITEPRLIITADADAAHKSVVRAMDAAGQAGFDSHQHYHSAARSGAVTRRSGQPRLGVTKPGLAGRRQSTAADMMAPSLTPRPSVVLGQCCE